ncbi:hypothetical protein AAW12_10700 [Sphingobacterium sp. Ag1]|nr:hypothetical protein AAW12_10700 [Sphingobacterium sp. Ag1]
MCSEEICSYSEYSCLSQIQNQKDCYSEYSIAELEEWLRDFLAGSFDDFKVNGYVKHVQSNKHRQSTQLKNAQLNNNE